jgi:hypothetical protein
MVLLFYHEETRKGAANERANEYEGRKFDCSHMGQM